MIDIYRQERKGERGQTVILVGFSMLALLAMAALAIDVATLYIARIQAQAAADAAALAGAKAFVTSGYTTNPGIGGSTVCSGGSPGTGLADLNAQAAMSQNLVMGVAPTVTTTCNFSQPQNPQITATVQRTGLPILFARIWPVRPSVSATATAEAYNPSGIAGGAPIQVSSVKPLGIPNCDPNNASPPNPNCSGGAAYILDPANNYAVANPSTVLSTNFVDLNETGAMSPTNLLTSEFVALDLPISSSSVSCPSTAAPWGTCTSVNSSNPGYFESMACANSTPISCGQTLPVDPNSGLSHLVTATGPATMCLIHATRTGPNRGQDNITPGSPYSIDGGSYNPDPALQNANNISRSDSVITIPIWDNCVSGPCTSVTVVGFLQLGVDRVRTANNRLRSYVLNVVGCGSASTTAPAVSGGGVSPIPVRLIGG